MANPTTGSIRLTGHGLVAERERVRITFDGVAIEALRGETVAAALLASGNTVFRQTRFKSAPRGIFCGMGVCQDCLVTVNGRQNVRACMTEVSDGLEVKSGGSL